MTHRSTSAKELAESKERLEKLALYFIYRHHRRACPCQDETLVSFMAAIPQFFKVAQQVGKGFRIESWGAQTPPRRKDLRFDVPSRANSWADDSDLTLLELERRHIERVLQEEHGYVDQTARRLGIPRSSLYQKIKKHGIVLTKV